MKKPFYLHLIKSEKLIFAFVILILSSSLFSQEKSEDYSFGKKITLSSDILQEERDIYVYFPDTYDGQSARYPVIYLLDGGLHFKHVGGSAHFLASIGYMPEAIVVAIPNTDRRRDFTPTNIEQMPTSGGAKQFHQFLEEELIPYMDEHFATNTYRILIGHSLGGLFSLWSLQEHPETFNTYIAISPYLMYENNLVVNKATDDILSNYKTAKKLYITLGKEPNYYEAIDQYLDILKEKDPKNLDFKYVHMENENHASIPHLSIYHGFEYIFSGYSLSPEVFQQGLKAIDKHYQALAEEFDYDIQTPEAVINILGYTYLNKGKKDKAISIFNENVKRYPLSANVYDSLGEAYEKSGNNEEARKNYEIAVELGKQVHHQFQATFEKNLARVSQSL